ncbi:ABC transporter substrate-binding protein [Cohnella hashimotonis]|uniref:Extracellular solute-binding protein n=1 Tax=Cohnella hashimotonis TaxID=2826895 RepID=A0ABT6TAF7_9BACL|nr:extracellular solute-binding protein [Cohnella hashimotonis]MDI4643625.1 extracellular solute-binding protein [Cohnella hashimotonis]
MRKSWLSFLSFALLALLISGCGANGNNEASPSAQPSGEASQPAQSSGAEAEEVTLKYASWMSKGEDKPTLDAFMQANPNIKIADEVIDGKQYSQLIQTRILSEDAPDVYLLPFDQYTKYAKEGHLLDLTDEPGMKLMIDNPLVDEAFKIDGKRYGFMVNSGAPINPIYYNKKIFEKYNLAPPTNAEEFLKVSETLKANNVEPLVFGAKDAWTLSGTLFTAMFRSYALPKANNDIFYSLATGSAKPSELIDYPLSFIAELTQKGYISKASSTLTYDQSVQYFADGKAAMLPQGTWVPTLDPIVNANKDVFELGAFVPPVPEVDGKKHALSNGDRILVISSKTKNVEAAKKLFNFFVEPANLRAYIEAQSLFTVLKGLDFKTAPVLQDFVNSFASDSFAVTIGSKSALTPAFNKEVDIALQNILVGSTVSKELKRLDEEFEKTKSQMVIKE